MSVDRAPHGPPADPAVQPAAIRRRRRGMSVVPISWARSAADLGVPTEGAMRARAERRITLRQMLFAADLAAAAAACVLSGAIGGLGLAPLLAFGLIGAMAWPLATFLCGLYARNDPPSWTSSIAEGKQVVVICLGISWPLLGLAAALGADLAVVISVAATALLAIFTLGTRGIARSVAHRVEPLRQRTVVLGSGVVAARLVERLLRHPELGIELIGVVDDEPHEMSSVVLPHLGGRVELRRILESFEVDRVIVAFSRSSHSDLLGCIRVCRDANVAVDVIPRLFELLDGARRVDRVGGMPMMALDVADLTRTSRATKRALDVVVSAALLFALAPAMALVALAIRLDSHGRVFFRQARAGRAGREFCLYKFRSMEVDADARKTDLIHLNESADGVMFKIRKDPRVTRVGAFIRRWSVDELPQLLNVLLGHMSLVGPRPLIRVESVAADSSENCRRVDLRPGLTGPWQIYGRSDIPFHEMLGFDYQYVAGWSLARDLEILVATVPALLSRRGAY
jgi:exopolysaccharide biosynthesis polyprenyl glycosylphosphotransferase